MKFDLNDILLVPAISSNVLSRKEEVNTRYDDGYLPLFNAPMDRVINTTNETVFDFNGINTVQVRGVKPILDHSITSMSLNEIIEAFELNSLDPNGRYLIDMANGHISIIPLIVKEIKDKFPNLFIMVGNIAHPETYKVLSEAGANAVRLSIGTGGSCLTSVHTGIGYPIGSLISECLELKREYGLKAFIVADGGMKDYSDIIKSLALGADYVMIGNLLNKTIESAGGNYLFGRFKVSQNIANWAYLNRLPIYKSMRGMSTKEVQKDWGKSKLTSSEGTVSKNKVEYATYEFIENFEDYLKSQMSYVGAKTLEEFIGNVKYNIISNNSLLRYKK